MSLNKAQLVPLQPEKWILDDLKYGVNFYFFQKRKNFTDVLIGKMKHKIQKHNLRQF